MVHSCNAQRRAFTLIELLVVIAIIAILAAILFPVFAQAKLAAKKTAGLAQMKQIGTGVQLYAGDYDDGLPTWDWYNAIYPTGTYREAVWAAAGSPQANRRMWDALLVPYIKSDDITKAATVAATEFGGIFKSPGADYPTKNNRSIGINQLLVWDITVSNTCEPDTSTGTGCFRWPTGSLIEESAMTVFVGDSGRGGRIEPLFFGNGYNDTFATPQAVPTWSTPWRYGKDSANYVYTDSHAKTEKGNKMFPNPGPNHGLFNNWTAAEKQGVLCSAVKWFAPSTTDKNYIRAGMTGGGANCQ